MTRTLGIILLVLIPMLSYTQDIHLKNSYAVRIQKPPKIDGIIEEEIWKDVNIISDFVQYLPIEGNSPDHKTEVRIAYDNEAIYFAAFLYDSATDSILGELGSRDAEGINADYFRVALDPYNNRQDAYFFGVYFSGVQFDSKVSDFTFDAVWESATSINENGWTAEIKIPYSAIRFPKKAEQLWALQLNRSVRRTREFVQWAQTPSKANNPLIYWGNLEGINNVEAPIRLSFTPYISTYVERTPYSNSEGSTAYSNSLSYNAGADVKYGIDERFTLDMTLFPDFGQVQSDNKVKNLSYREVTYDENRPFFKESLELFNKDNLFYSRRIGKIPSGFFSAEYSLQPGEKLEENPVNVKLLNAIKVSGRTDHGMGIGIFNAITDDAYAIISDSAGNERKILTEPLTNFNVVVFDQQLKNNSSAYLINTNVVRDKNWPDANVTGGGFTISNKKNNFAADASGAVSQLLERSEDEPVRYFTNKVGYKYFLGVRKLGGLFDYGISNTVIDNNFYTSDLGYQTINSQVIYRAYINHNVHKPYKKFRNSYNNIQYRYSQNFISGKPTGNEINLNLFATFLDYNSVFTGGGFTPGNYYDYNEPRIPGRYSKGIKYFYVYAGFSTDYRKQVAVDLNLDFSNFIKHFVSEGYNANMLIRYRINDKFTLRLTTEYHFDPYNYGFADIDDSGNVIYGLRKLNTYVNGINAQYLFKNDMSVSLNVRHYWSTAKYRKYLTILENGDFAENDVYDENNDFNFNAFNIDLVYSWQFAPGSKFLVVYKNAIENDQLGVTSIPDFGKNFEKLIDDPQINSISIKLLYYLDYLYIKKKFQKV